MRYLLFVSVALLVLAFMIGCANKQASAPPAKDAVESALTKAALGSVKVDEDRDKGVVTLKGDVQSAEQKEQAESLAKQAAPGRVIANEIAVRPPGMEDTAKKVESNTDDAIKDHFKALVAANKWEDQHIDSDVKNGVLTLKGDVDTAEQRAAVEKASASLPGVKQVVNELEVKGAKHKAKGGM